MKVGKKTIWLSLFWVILSFHAFAQKTTVRGRVTDAKTNEPLPSVVVKLENSDNATVTDVEGEFTLEITADGDQLSANYIGYKQVIKKIQRGKDQRVNFRLTENTTETQEIVVTAKKGRYRNKNNPAVELIRKVIEHRDKNRKEGFDYYQYEKYEKIQFALSNVTEKFKNKRELRNFQYVFQNMDSTKLHGKPILPLYIKETLSDVYYRKSPKDQKEIVKGTKMTTFEGYIDNNGVGSYLSYLYQDINIYDNDIMVFTNRFLSPIANLAPTFYMYRIDDTLDLDGTTCIKLNFLPRNKTDFLFQGDLYITKDSNYAVKKVEMTVNSEINLNWVKELHVTQEFEEKDQQGFVLVRDELMADFGPPMEGKPGIFGQRNTSYKDFVLNKPIDGKLFDGINVDIKEDAAQKADSFWTDHRHQELSVSEKGIYTTIDSVKKLPAFKRTMNLAMLMFTGYKGFGPVEMGPVSTFYSFNPVEGFRLRFGGRTTPIFSKKINFETYVAYGFKDEKYKYYLGTTYSLTKRTIWEFPLKTIKAFYQYDTKIPGQELQFVQEDNFLLSFKRGVNDKWLYNNIFYAEYLNEFRNHFSFAVGFKYWQQSPAGALHFNKVDYTDRSQDIQYLPTTEASLTLRFAPREIFYQGKLYRVPLVTKYPVFTLRMLTSIQDFLGTEYNYQQIALHVKKRFYLSQLGYVDVAGESGRIFGQVPYPLLFVHRANQTYAYQLDAYSLMNFLEFVSDKYGSIIIDHHFNGFLFNKIPLFKRLRWRELFSLKSLWGSVSSVNNPEKNDNVYKQPTENDGTPIAYSLAASPYFEGSVGIENIFKFIRIDLIRRFTYLDHPHVAQYGVRVRIKFDF
jgi:hypothetical protein